MSTVFLTAEWNHLIMANYEIDAAVLQPYLPAFTELDYFDGKAYVSLVGFLFEKIKIKGISIPFHTHFPEVNLRLYVKHTKAGGAVQRGVVFISEIVPKPAIAWVANNIYREKYAATKMSYSTRSSPGALHFSYGWQWKQQWNVIAASVEDKASPIVQGTKEAFIFEHYYGFARVNDKITNQYTVEHPVWNIYPVTSFQINCDFAKQYGQDFSLLNNAAPASVFVAEGSAVRIKEKMVLKA